MAGSNDGRLSAAELGQAALTTVQELTGYEPEVSLEDGVLATYSWYASHGRPA